VTITAELVDALTLEQLASDAGFIALCNTWQAEKHCPLVMPDYLRELGCWRAAEVATWAVNHMTESGGRLIPSEVFRNDSTTYEFHRTTWAEECAKLPDHERCEGLYYNFFPTFHLCIADFLLNADPETLFSKAPPKPEHCII
jgi:hypothetical protein